MKQLGRYLRTARQTRWAQLLWRLRYSFERRRPLLPSRADGWRWRADVSPRCRRDFPHVPVLHVPAVMGAAGMGLLRRGVFRHLNEEHDLGRDQTDWRLGPIQAGRLWTVTLHYHAWAYALAQQAADEQEQAAEELFGHYVGDWIERCRLDQQGSRDLAWNAYAIATRLAWWVRCCTLLRGTLFQRRPEFAAAFLASMWQQAAYLRDHLEWDLQANHLLRDAVGLAWAGRFFDEAPARGWLETGTQLGLAQAREQVLPDGGHYERSPMYHLHVMEDILTLALLVEDSRARTALAECWQSMAEYAAWLRHPDGDIALCNDAALHGACAPEQMLRCAPHLGVTADAAPRRGGRHFASTGVAVWHGEPWSLFFDVGPGGPDHQPGHTHADVLGVECSYRGKRLVVDPGTYAYDDDARRVYDRSTAAHNTVCIDEQDSSEVWHIFRVGRRAHPHAVSVTQQPGGMTASAAHTGYDHLAGAPRHTRRVSVEGGGALVLVDRVEGRGAHALAGGLLLAPAWRSQAHGGGWELRCDALQAFVQVRGPQGLVLSEQRRAYHPEFGRELETTRLCWRCQGTLPIEVTTSLSGSDPSV